MSKKEINFEALKALACSGPVDEFTDHTVVNGMTEEMQKLLLAAREEERVAKLKAAVMSIMALSSEIEDMKKNFINNIRAARATEANMKMRLAYIDMASKYAAATNDYLPLHQLVTHGVPSPSNEAIVAQWAKQQSAGQTEEAKPAATKKKK